MYGLETIVALNNPAADRAALEQELLDLAKPIHIPPLATKVGQTQPAEDAGRGMSTEEEVCDAIER